MSLIIFGVLFIIFVVLASRLVETTASDVSDPLDDIMIRIIEFRFEDFQVTNLEAWWSERYFEVHGYRWSRPFLFGVGFEQINFRW